MFRSLIWCLLTISVFTVCNIGGAPSLALESGISCDKWTDSSIPTKQFLSLLTTHFLNDEFSPQVMFEAWSRSHKISEPLWNQFEKCLNSESNDPDTQCYIDWVYLLGNLRSINQIVKGYRICEAESFAQGSNQPQNVLKHIDQGLYELQTLINRLTDQILQKFASKALVLRLNSIEKQWLDEKLNINQERKCRFLASQLRTEVLTEIANMAKNSGSLSKMRELIEASRIKISNLWDCPEDTVIEYLYPIQKNPEAEVNDWINFNCNPQASKNIQIACSFSNIQKDVENIRNYFNNQGYANPHMAWLPRYKDFLLGESTSLPMYHKYLVNLEKLQVTSLFLITELVKAHPFRKVHQVINYLVEKVVSELSFDLITKLSRTCRYKSFLQYRGIGWIEAPECDEILDLIAAWVRRSPGLSPELLVSKLGKRTSDFNIIRVLNNQLAGLNFSTINSHPMPYLFATESQLNHMLPKFLFSDSELEILLQWVQSEPLPDMVIRSLYKNAMKMEAPLLSCEDTVNQLRALLKENIMKTTSDFPQKLDLNQCVRAQLPNIWHLLGLEMWIPDGSLNDYTTEAVKLELISDEVSLFHNYRIGLVLRHLWSLSGDIKNLKLDAIQLEAMTDSLYISLDDQVTRGNFLKLASKVPSQIDEKYRIWIDSVIGGLK